MRTVRGNKKVTTVWLEPENIGSRPVEKIFFCFSCRVPLIQYTGKVVTVVPGDQPYEPSTILKCKGSVKKGNIWEECGHYFCFVGSVFTKNPQLD
jgi:hypothetical protein